jgi:cell division protein FtsL
MGRGAAAAAARRGTEGRSRGEGARSGHEARRHGSGRAPGALPRRMSGGAAPAVALPLPARLLNARFTRTLRARGGGLLDALLSGRGWIALVFVLLAGIVFFNVDLLQMNRDIAQNAEKISALKRENARLLLDEARLAKSARIQEEAAKLGLVLPAPGEVRYLRSRPLADARRAAKSITAPDPSNIAPAPADAISDPAATQDKATTGAGIDPATGAPGIDPATGFAIDPATGFPIDPATGAPAYDPVTGAPLDPATGAPLDLSAGTSAPETATGATAADPSLGATP